MKNIKNSSLSELKNAEPGDLVVLDGQECIVFRKYKRPNIEGNIGLAFIKTMPEEFDKEYEWGALAEAVNSKNRHTSSGIRNSRTALSFVTDQGEKPAFLDSDNGNNTIWQALDSWRKIVGNPGKWFIPSSKELTEIYKCLFNEEKGNIEGYWSSAECKNYFSFDSMFVVFYYGNTNHFPKSIKAKVLFCRAF